MTARVHPPVTTEQRRENSRKAGQLSQSPQGLANRLARKMASGELTDQQQAQIRQTLKPYIIKPRTTNTPP